MQTASDDLTKPLGQGLTAKPARWRRPAAIALVGVACLGAAVIGGAALYGDPRGGQAVVRTEIAVRSAPSVPERPADAVPATQPRRDAEAVEAASGVKVVRGTGDAPPQSVVVQVPDAMRSSGRVPDPRLAESTRLGSLPRIGSDGSKAIDVYARPAPGGEATGGRIAIVLGGVGLSRAATDDAIGRLPATVTLAFAPYGTNLERENVRAREAGHETLLQLPMEPFDYPDSDPGPRTLTTGATPAENTENLHWAMGRFTGYVGLMNYMGGKITADDRTLLPILREAGQRGLGFLDDGSSSRSKVLTMAGETRAARADVVVDAVPRADQIDKALQRLEALAASGRLAVGTASALPITIERLARWAETLENRGIQLVPISAAMTARRQDSASR